MGDWIKVEDELPTGYVIIFSPPIIDGYDGDISVGCHAGKDKVNDFWSSGGIRYITHWMPLPNQPEDKNG